MSRISRIIRALRHDRVRLFVRGTAALGPRGQRPIGWLLSRAAGAFPPASRRDGRGALVAGLGLWLRGSRRRAAGRLAPVAGNARTSAGTRLQLAEMLIRAGALDEAGEVLAGRGTDARADELVLLARVNRSRGDFEAAIASAGRAVELAPGNRAARRALARARSEQTLHTPGWRPQLPDTTTPFVPVRGRVLHVVSHALPHWQGGYTIRTQSIARAQLRAGLEPTVAAGTDASAGRSATPAAPTWTIDGVTYRSLDPGKAGGGSSADLRAREAGIAAQIAEEVRPAVVHAATPYRDAQIALALRDRYGVPFVYEVRGFREEKFTSGATPGGAQDRQRQVIFADETECMRLADGVVTLSDGMREQIISRGVPADHVWVVPNAVEIEHFTPVPRDDALAARLGMDDTPVIGYISTFAAHENIACLIEATAELRRRGCRVRCLLVGDGRHGERRELEALAGKLGLLDGTVIFTGRIPYDAIAAYYSLMDVFVVPRLNDPVSTVVTPLKPYEAMAMERAVVVSRIPALMEMIVENQTALCFTAGDAKDLADTLVPLLGDPDRRRALGHAAREWVQANRTWAGNAEVYRRLYESLGAA